MQKTIDLVGKIGSMALIRREMHDIDYNIFATIAAQLKPGMIWVSSGATEIGRIDYEKRMGQPLSGPDDDVKADYAAQGQAILMQTYRQFLAPSLSLRQVLVEHTHFNDPEKRDHIRRLLLRSAAQGAVPVVNYNDPVSGDENRKMELSKLKKEGETHVVECVDNDETAAVIAGLVQAKTLLIFTSTEGIYADPADPKTLIDTITANTPEELSQKIEATKALCVGASRAWAGGARAKLTYITEPALSGTQVIIGNARHTFDDLLSGKAPCTRIGLNL